MRHKSEGFSVSTREKLFSAWVPHTWPNRSAKKKGPVRGRVSHSYWRRKENAQDKVTSLLPCNFKGPPDFQLVYWYATMTGFEEKILSVASVCWGSVTSSLSSYSTARSWNHQKKVESEWQTVFGDSASKRFHLEESFLGMVGTTVIPPREAGAGESWLGS